MTSLLIIGPTTLFWESWSNGKKNSVTNRREKREYLLTGQSSPSEKKTVTILKMTLHISINKKHASN